MGSLDFRAAAALFVNSLGGAMATTVLLGDADFPGRPLHVYSAGRKVWTGRA